jgi:hypothetical protein
MIHNIKLNFYIINIVLKSFLFNNLTIIKSKTKYSLCNIRILKVFYFNNKTIIKSNSSFFYIK